MSCYLFSMRFFELRGSINVHTSGLNLGYAGPLLEMNKQLPRTATGTLRAVTSCPIFVSQGARLLFTVDSVHLFEMCFTFYN